MNSYQSPEKDMSFILSQLNDIAAAVMHAAEAGTLDDVLQRIAEASKTLVNARYAALGVPNYDEDRLQIFKTSGMTQDEIAMLEHPPEGHGLLGVIMNERTTLRLEDMKEDHRSVGFPENHPHMTSLLGVPILVGQELFGMLYLCDRIDGLPFTQEDEWLIKSLAGYAALAIAGVRLREQKGRVTLLEERERVSMELHDGVIQSLYAIGMQMQLMRLAEQVSDEKIGETISALDQVIGDVREYILDLKSANYKHQTIKESLQDALSRLTIPSETAIIVDAPNQRALFTEHKLEAICQIVNEAVSNAIRHAEADKITIFARQDSLHFHMTITDNGKGFKLDELNGHRGLGLRNMHQRMKLHNGEIEIDTAPGEGTQITLEFPVKKMQG